MSRYTIHPIATSDCNSIRPEVIASADTIQEATRLAEQHHAVYGAAVLDTESGLIDFGAGFGVETDVAED